MGSPRVGGTRTDGPTLRAAPEPKFLPGTRTPCRAAPPAPRYGTGSGPRERAGSDGRAPLLFFFFNFQTLNSFANIHALGRAGTKLSCSNRSDR